MLAITIPVNLFVLGGALILGFLVGFLTRGGQLAKWKRKVISLETEMLTNHADILDLQKDKAVLELKLKELAIPVIPINAVKDETATGTSDSSARKPAIKPQSPPIKKHS
ncbi:MAG: hypothetical protein P0Y53_02700 [Candidatus Pseudobacter hemicellulosilyticus]|uniref:LapA family protein n=1 Tax=Candidatus Pseudobacter hemicellulosilyticus TaxID=3121375 RepID=A0AAJ6BHL2_9BACT|nr:MAG: hypothetical protein P0Y53_02700 [Pseudobacter sp.]